jgi:hypothetical protein
MEVFNGETFQSKCRFSGLPQSQANTIRNDSTMLDYDDMAPIKQRIVNLVDLLIGQNIHFERILISLQQPKRQWWFKMTRKARKPECVVDKDDNIWGYSLHMDPTLRNTAFEVYVDWLEHGSKGRAPNLTWDGCFTLVGG